MYNITITILQSKDLILSQQSKELENLVANVFRIDILYEIKDHSHINLELIKFFFNKNTFLTQL